MVVAQGAGGGMRRHHRTRGELQHVLHAADAEMADVEEHAEPLHLREGADPRPGEPTARRVLAAAVAEGAASEVRDRSDPHSEPMHRLEQLDVVADPGHALQREHERDAPLADGTVHVRPIQAQRHGIRVPLGEPVGRLAWTQALERQRRGAARPAAE